VNDQVLNSAVFQRLQQATESKPGVLSELCHDYIMEARSTVVQLQQALDGSDAAKLRERAHYLKGSSMMLGAQKLSQVCATLERMGREANLTEAAPAVCEASEALREVELELAQVVGPSVLPAEGSAA
jgi:HPt (histidine-containing phosphotransfer) domain-containing protein